MAVISVVNQKGGVAKTSTVVNLSYNLATFFDKRILVVDCDPQHNTTLTLGVLPPYDFPFNLVDVLERDDINIESCIFKSKFDNLDLISSSFDLFGWHGQQGTSMFTALQRRLTDEVKSKYDYIFIDCPPNIDALVNNALTASDYYILPIKCEDFYALKGMQQLTKHIEQIKENLNKDLKLLGALITMYDGRTSVSQKMSVAIKVHFSGRGMFETMIRTNTDLNKATLKNIPVCKHKKACLSCQDYLAMAEELIGMLEG